ncbi:MAG TPA: hypothetical protein VJO14_02155 [Bacteroidota bacterium]|nr:hypothetical protein [Bacteroidota bacterium]
MGVVYKAHDTKLDRTIALKFPLQQLAASEQDRARFLQEARAAASLDHAIICTIWRSTRTTVTRTGYNPGSTAPLWWADVLHKSLALYSNYLSEHPDDAYRRMAYAVNLTYAGRNRDAVTEGKKALKLSSGDPMASGKSRDTSNS